MSPALKRGATISAGLHLAALLALIVVIPAPLPPPPPPDDTMEVEFEGTAVSAQKSQNTGKHAAPAEATEPAEKTPAIVEPKKAPIEAPPPPPPPPPEAPPQAAPVVTRTLDTSKLMPPPPSEVAEHLKPPPPMKLPPSKEPPKPVQIAQASKPPLHEPVKDTKPLDTVTHQPNPTKNPAVDTKSAMNTLEKLMADQPQEKPPTHKYNPSRGGAPDAGGQKHGNLTGSLSEAQRKTIGDSVRHCYSEDTAAKDYASYSAKMTVTIDSAGVVHDVVLDPAAQARAASDEAYRAFAERAEQAVLDPGCAKLPLPPSLLGQPSAKLTFLFRP